MLGAAKEKQTTAPPSRAEDLAGIRLPDHERSTVRLGDLWRERPAAIAFLRHYGWVFCQAHALQLQRDRTKFEDAGANLVLIGQGSPEQAAAFRDKHGLDLPLLADADRRSYAAAGAKVGTLAEVVGPRVVAKGVLRAARAGVRQGQQVGHGAQLGGVLVVATDGAVTWAHLSDDASDTPPNGDVLDAVRRAVEARADVR